MPRQMMNKFAYLHEDDTRLKKHTFEKFSRLNIKFHELL